MPKANKGENSAQNANTCYRSLQDMELLAPFPDKMRVSVTIFSMDECPNCDAEP
jgi:hypothetical protein